MERSNNSRKKAEEYKKKIELHKKNEKLFKQTCGDVRRVIKLVEESRDLSRTWMHVDMDMFYAAVEIRDNPGLKDVPLAIGDMSMISTSNYVARKYGVRAAMPGFIGKKICPELVFVQCNFQKYTAVSKIFKSILEAYDPDLESMGLDEANLDVTGYLLENALNSDEGR